jgi:CRISPR-associated endonuclease/helicase Cas3
VDVRAGFRHELASTLALFDVLRRHAPIGHPSRLGEWAALSVADEPEAPREPPSALEREVLDLSPQDFDLVAFLVCAHHGKVRARLHASSADQSARVRDGGLPIRGVYEGDSLPPVALATSEGSFEVLPQSELTLEPARLGLSTTTGRSWSERVDALRTHYGPFALAYLEGILRAADIRASRDSSLADAEVTA